MLHGLEQNWMNAEVSTGTTVLAFKYNEGVMIAADSRTSTGNYVSNRFTDKLTKITDFVYCCRSGSAADTQAIADIVSYNINLYENQHDKHATVYNVAREFRQISYGYRDQLLAAIIVAGYDKTEEIGKVFSIPLGGMFCEEEVTVSGSGSAYVQAYIDKEYTPNMDLNKSFNFASAVVGHAMTFDGHSGGVIRLGTLTKQGMKRYTLQQTLKNNGANWQTSIEMIY